MLDTFFRYVLSKLRIAILRLLVDKNPNFPGTCARCVHDALVDPGFDTVVYVQRFEPALDPIHHAAAVLIDNPHLGHALKCEAFPLFPLPAEDVV